jgi:hypothetical protein
MTHAPREALYGWAFNSQGQPIPIHEAGRGVVYRCPVCGGEFIPKKGEIKTHHYAHAQVKACSPEQAAERTAIAWVAGKIRALLASNQPLYTAWENEGKTVYVSLLKHVTSVVTNALVEGVQADIVLMSAENKPLALIELGLTPIPSDAQISAWAKSGLAVLVLDPLLVKQGQTPLPELAAQGKLYGGWALMSVEQTAEHPPQAPDAIRATLRALVSRPPHVFVGELDENYKLNLPQGGVLWLPPDLWRDTIGGNSHALRADIDIYTQEWDEAEASWILCYVTQAKTHAIAIRRYPPQTSIRLRLDSLRIRQITPLQIAAQLVGLVH